MVIYGGFGLVVWFDVIENLVHFVRQFCKIWYFFLENWYFLFIYFKDLECWSKVKVKVKRQQFLNEFECKRDCLHKSLPGRFAFFSCVVTRKPPFNFCSSKRRITEREVLLCVKPVVPYRHGFAVSSVQRGIFFLLGFSVSLCASAICLLQWVSFLFLLLCHHYYHHFFVFFILLLFWCFSSKKPAVICLLVSSVSCNAFVAYFIQT